MIKTLCKHGIEEDTCSYCLENRVYDNHQAIKEDKKEEYTIKDLQQEATELVNKYIIKYNLNPINVKVKDTRQGWARYSIRAIIIPIWPLKVSKLYWKAYIIHEICHFIKLDILGKTGHGPDFKDIERTILKEDYKLIPEYSRAYIKVLKQEDGQLVFNRKLYRSGQQQLKTINIV